jgi:hypothetical protein
MSARQAAFDAIATAREAVAAGDYVDLSGLDALIARACDEAKTAPAPTRAAAAEELLSLVRELDWLSLELAAQQEAALRAESTSSRRAAAAYKSRD